MKTRKLTPAEQARADFWAGAVEGRDLAAPFLLGGRAMIKGVRYPPDADGAEYDLGDRGKIIVTGQRCRELNLNAREVAAVYDNMLDQGCPKDIADEWLEGRGPRGPNAIWGAPEATGDGFGGDGFGDAVRAALDSLQRGETP